MTRSVEIPCEHGWVTAQDGDGELLDYIICGICGVRQRDVIEQATRSVEIPEAAVEAAAEGLRTQSAFEEPRILARAALEAALPYLAPAEPEHTYGNGTHYPPTGGAHVTERCSPNCPPAPAGDGGLREALEKLIGRNNYPDGHVMTAALESLLAAHPAAPAVPQPADREALMLVLTKWDVGGWKYEDAEGYRERVCDSLLAVLAGEQEQVEP